MTVHCELSGSTVAHFKVPVYDNTLGIEYDEEVELCDIDFEGSTTCTPGVRYNRNGDPGDPPEFNSDLDILLSETELLAMVVEWFSEWPTLTVLDAGWDALEENIRERVLDDPEPYEVEPDYEED